MNNFKLFNSIFHKFLVISKRCIIRTKYVEILGVYAPVDFPYENYQHIFIQFITEMKRTKGKQITFSEFFTSWISVADRFSSMTFADYEFSLQMKKFGVIPPNPLEREIQDTSLFSFFINAQSLIESLCYSIYILGSMKSPENFPMDYEYLENVHPALVSNKFNSYFQSEQITKDLKSLIDSKEYAEIKMIRNTLIHRTSAPRRRRTLFPMNFKYSPHPVVIPLDWWVMDGKIKENFGDRKRKIDHRINLINITSINREWILKSIIKILDSTNYFVSNDFSK